MNRVKLGVIIFAVCVMATAIAPWSNAQVYNNKTIVTFNKPVEIPGVGTQVLPAGKYVFKVVDSLSNRDIVQIFNEDETHVFATILAIPNYRLKPTSETVIRFKERTAGSPEALKAWFYPGNTFGQEFVYPKARAIEIAKEANEPVLTMPTELASELTPPPEARTQVPPMELKEAPIAAVEPSGREIEIAQVIPPKELPKTASSLPLLGLLGLLSLGAGLALSLASKRIPLRQEAKR